jgi:hypothetical protein
VRDSVAYIPDEQVPCSVASQTWCVNTVVVWLLLVLISTSRPKGWANWALTRLPYRGAHPLGSRAPSRNTI